MIFGKIDYLNLLPFHVFLKAAPLKTQVKKAIEFKKGVPSKLNRALNARKIDAAECFYDLGQIWHEKTNLPFVFGRFSYVKNGSFYKKLVAKFLQKNVKIPNYILAQYAKSRDISEQDIKWYLKFISYKIGPKEQKSLRKFFKEDRLLKAEKKELNFL